MSAGVDPPECNGPYRQFEACGLAHTALLWSRLLDPGKTVHPFQVEVARIGTQNQTSIQVEYSKTQTAKRFDPLPRTHTHIACGIGGPLLAPSLHEGLGFRV